MIQHVHGHMVLTKLKVNSYAWREQFAWVRGYILALEDVVRDVDKIRAETPDEERNLLLFKVQDKVLYTWNQAHVTLKTLEKMEHEHLETVQREPGAGGPGGTAATPDPEDQGRVPDPGAV